MPQDNCKERLLGDCDYQQDDHARAESNVSSKHYNNWTFFRGPSCFLRNLVFVALSLSLVSNVVLLHRSNVSQCGRDIGRSNFSHIGYDYPKEYHLHTEYGTNSSSADVLWDDIDTSPILVALSDDYARQHNLETSARFPWDDTKGIYHIKAFHHLHCLKNMRKAYTDMARGISPIISTAHFYHCLDTLRQDIMCLADDTPMPTIDAIHHIGEGQTRQCRDWNKLIAWTQEPQRHACYRMLSDYRKVPHTLEQFAYCNKDSPYLPIAEAYFMKHGHADPFED